MIWPKAISLKAPTFGYAHRQAVRDEGAREEWVVYMLTAVADSARDGIGTVGAIRARSCCET